MIKYKLKSCPFCGEIPKICKHFKEETYQLIHRCKVIGPISIEWTDNLDCLVKTWNTRSKPLQVGERFDDCIGPIEKGGGDE